MSQRIPQTPPRAMVPADSVFNPDTTTVNIGEEYATFRIPIDVWNEGLKDEQKNLESQDPNIDLKAVTARMKVNIVRTAAVQTLVSQPDPRDHIPLVYSSKKRKIIQLVGFALSSVAILGVHIAGNAGHVPGFQLLPLTADPMHSIDPSGTALGSTMFSAGIFGIVTLGVLGIHGGCFP